MQLSSNFLTHRISQFFMEAPYSLSKAVYHTDRIKTLQEGKPIAPLNIQIDLEVYCNDNCSFCSYRAEESHNKVMMELLSPNKTKLPMVDEFKPIGQPNQNSSLPLYLAEEIPKQMAEAGIPSLTMTGGGESTLWKGYDIFVENLIKYGIEIGLITNGSVLTDSRIDDIAKHFRWVRFSMDAGTPQIHRNMHRTSHNDFERRLETLKKLVVLRKTYQRIPSKQDEGLTIGVNFVITNENFVDIENACRLFAEIGVDYIRFSFMYIEGIGIGQINPEYTKDAPNLFKTCIQKYGRPDFLISPALYKLDSYMHPNDDFNTCYMQRFTWALAADCKVYPCCIQKYIPGFELADIREMTLKQMIEKTHKKMTNLDVKTCPPCWMRDRNKAQASAIERPKHANFI